MCEPYFSCQSSEQALGKLILDITVTFYLFFISGETCTDPGRPPDGYQIATSYEEGSLVHFNCSKPGFAPDPPTPIICELNDGKIGWNSTVPVCIGEP